MKSKPLKKVRVYVSLTFFLAFAALFLDLDYSIPEFFSDAVVYFQFVPSLLKFLTVGTLAASGFIFVTVLTLVFGRVYCSFLCPLGVLQDLAGFVRKKTKKSKYSYKKAFTKIRYGILAGVILASFSGSIIALTLLDPFSNFGRMMTHLLRPIAIGINNALVFSLEKLDVYTIQPADLKGIAPFSLGFAITVFAVVIWMSLCHGRLFCNTLCPVGTFLGFLSRFSLLKIKFNASQCLSCKACEKVCKASCLDLDNSRIDFSRCVACYNCLEVCPSAAVKYRPAFQKSKADTALKDAGKRDFMIQTLAFLFASGASTAGARQIEIYRDSTVPIIRKSAISPPGSGSVDNLMNNCTACHLCVSACPTQVLQPAFLEYGLLGIMKPRMDNKTSFCDYECVVCTTVCPSGAILKQSVDSKKLIQVGKAKFVRKNCVVYTQNTDCGACAEHCPTKAVRMVFDKEVNLRAPKVDESICVGCGACEFACPTRPYKAIYVESNPVHLTAEKPQEEKIEEVSPTENFPF